MEKNKEMKDLIFYEEDAVTLLNQYKNLFDNEKAYYELELAILNYLKSVHQNIKELNIQYNYSTILLMLKEKIMHFICDKIKQGDVNLEINIVDQYIKHSNSIKPRFDKLVASNAKKEKYEKYKQLAQLNVDFEKDFIDKLWEDAIIETIETYNGNDTFSGEIFQNFKIKITNVDTEYEQFVETRPKVKSL